MEEMEVHPKWESIIFTIFYSNFLLILHRDESTPSGSVGDHWTPSRLEWGHILLVCLASRDGQWHLQKNSEWNNHRNCKAGFLTCLTGSILLYRFYRTTVLFGMQIQVKSSSLSSTSLTTISSIRKH